MESSNLHADRLNFTPKLIFQNFSGSRKLMPGFSGKTNWDSDFNLAILYPVSREKMNMFWIFHLVLIPWSCVCQDYKRYHSNDDLMNIVSN